MLGIYENNIKNDNSRINIYIIAVVPYCNGIKRI